MLSKCMKRLIRSIGLKYLRLTQHSESTFMAAVTLSTILSLVLRKLKTPLSTVFVMIRAHALTSISKAQSALRHNSVKVIFLYTLILVATVYTDVVIDCSQVKRL